jgi:hypothetical protein
MLPLLVSLLLTQSNGAPVEKNPKVIQVVDPAQEARLNTVLAQNRSQRSKGKWQEAVASAEACMRAAPYRCECLAAQVVSLNGLEEHDKAAPKKSPGAASDFVKRCPRHPEADWARALLPKKP